MAEYIEREATCKDCLHYEPCLKYGNVLDPLHGGVKCDSFKSAADVEEVRHERWKWGYQCGHYGIWCTFCGAGWVDGGNAAWIAHSHRYCPKCGAKMDGADNG